MPISSTLRGSFPTVGSYECCKIRLHLRPWASSLFWSSETQIANAWFPCLRQKQGEIPERSCCFKCWPLTSEVCRFCSLSWRLSPQGVRLGHPNSRTGVSSASLLSTRLLRSAIPSGLLMPQMVLCLRWKLVKGFRLLCIWVWRNICISNLYSSYIFYRMYYMYWKLCFCPECPMFEQPTNIWWCLIGLSGRMDAFFAAARWLAGYWAACWHHTRRVKLNDSKQRQLHRCLISVHVYVIFLHDSITYLMWTICAYIHTIYLDVQTHTNTRTCMYMYI